MQGEGRHLAERAAVGDLGPFLNALEAEQVLAPVHFGFLFRLLQANHASHVV